MNFWDPSGLKAKGQLYSVGSSGYDITRMQLTLREMGFRGKDGYVLDTDGKFGSNTKFAVESFQRSRSLDIDGIVGDYTWAALGFSLEATTSKTVTATSTTYMEPNWTVEDNRLMGVTDPEFIGVVAVGAVAIKAVGIPSAINAGWQWIGSLLAPKVIEEASKVDPNKLNHIFGNTGHNLALLVDKLGGQVNTYNAVQQAVQAQVNTQGLTGIFNSVTNPIVVNVSGYTVHAGGSVINGFFHPGTFFIP